MPTPKFNPGDQVRVSSSAIINNPTYAKTMPNSIGTVLYVHGAPHWEYVTKEEFPELFAAGVITEDQWVWLYWIDLPTVPLGNDKIDNLISQAKEVADVPQTAWALFEFDLEPVG